MTVWCLHITRTCLGTSLKQVRSLPPYSTRGFEWPSSGDRVVFTHSKELPGDIFEAGAEFVFYSTRGFEWTCSVFTSSVSHHFDTSVVVSYATKHLRGPCYTACGVTHSKDLPENIFEAGAEFAFILHERFWMNVLCRHFFSQSAALRHIRCCILSFQTFARHN